MKNATEPLPVPAHEELREVAGDSYAKLLARLSGLSVTHHFDAYGDIAWDSPEFSIDPADPRWELRDDDPLGATAWYRALPAETRARLGLEYVASTMKMGLEFERVLKRGLLEFAGTLPNGAPEFRYAYHEVIEEAQHSLMFQEFVNRSRFDAVGLRPLERFGTRYIVGLGRRFPALFFVFVLGGEEPIDYVQRKDLRSGDSLHPLLERVMRIHVTEEARHLSFARHYLRAQAPSLGRLDRLRLGIGAPVILSVMAQMMLKPSVQLVKRYRIPRPVMREAYTRNPAHRAESLASMRRVRKLCADMGLLTPGYRLVWRALRLTEAR
jgi:P-aminobenzoate N-oxygenase AurF